MQIMKHLITTVGEPKTRGGGGLERWVDEEDSQITMPEKGRRKVSEGMKGKEGGKERKSHTMATSANRDGVPVIWLRRWSHRQQESEVSFPFLYPRWVTTHPSWDLKIFHRYILFRCTRESTLMWSVSVLRWQMWASAARLWSAASLPHYKHKIFMCVFSII